MSDFVADLKISNLCRKQFSFLNFKISPFK